MDTNSTIKELSERVARLEADVAWLVHQTSQHSGAVSRTDLAAVAPPPAVQTVPSAPVTKPKTPKKAREPIAPAVWIAGVGALIFLAGVVFFFRWAIQQGWIGPELRVGLGILAGAALSAYAARQLLREHTRLGVALLIAGLGTLHFTFRVGTVDYHLYGSSFGFAAAAAITLAAGALATRAGSGGALTVSLLSAFATPIIFGPDGHRELSFATYLAVVMAATLGATFVTGKGARWHITRWIAVLGTWLLLLPAAMEVRQADAAWFLLLLVVHLLLSGLWAWLPWSTELPGTASALWIAASVFVISHGWLVWRTLALPGRVFSIPIIVAAGLNLALLGPIRARLGSRRADWALLSLALGYLALAAPVALSWRWAGAYWGVFAAALAWSARKAEGNDFIADATMLRGLAAAMAALTTLRWSIDGTFGFSVSGGGTPIMNPSFAAGALASLTWFLLVRVERLPLASLVFAAFEYSANLTLGFEGARIVQWLYPPLELSSGPSFAASIVITLIWAISGACQWMWGLPQQTRQQRAVIVAGYVWMAMSGFKLVASDLDRADTPLRALAFLGVGAIGMLAAMLASRWRRSGVSVPNDRQVGESS